MSALAFSASVVPRAVAAPRRASRAARRAASAPVRASGAAYDEVFDGNTGQMVKTLSQSVETVSAGGLDWSYRLGVPEEGVEVRPNKVLLVHGAGLVGFTYSKLIKELQLKGYVCVAPDMPGHGDSSKPAPGAVPVPAHICVITANVSCARPTSPAKPHPSHTHAYVITFGASLTEVPFDAIYSSPFRRACRPQCRRRGVLRCSELLTLPVRSAPAT